MTTINVYETALKGKSHTEISDIAEKWQWQEVAYSSINPQLGFSQSIKPKEENHQFIKAAIKEKYMILTSAVKYYMVI
jgi:hypothetical protein